MLERIGNGNHPIGLQKRKRFPQTQIKACFLDNSRAAEWECALKTLPDNIAVALSKHSKRLELTGLTTISESGATALAANQGILVFRGGRIIEHLGPIIASHKGGLSFDGMETLDDDAALSLVKYRGALFFFEMTDIGVKTANILARHQGRSLTLGLRAVPDDVAVALSKYQGEGLLLWSVVEISDGAAAALAKYRGELVLSDEVEKRVKRFR